MKEKLILDALLSLAGTPHDGDLVFTRSLTADEIEGVLAQSSGLGWIVLGVGRGGRDSWIAADEAVELRESKGPAAILLVDAAKAGAGMDGIYSAAREVTEGALFEVAFDLGAQKLAKPLREFATRAIQAAGTLGGKRREVPVRARFNLLSALLEDPDRPGLAVAELQLWPIGGPVEEAQRRLKHAANLVERLLMSPATAKTPEARIDGLRLEADTDPQTVRELVAILRGATGRNRTDSLKGVAQRSELWLGNLRPAFLNQTVTEIEIVSWRSKNGKLAAWSGLKQLDEESLPQFAVDPNNPKNKLEVRWRVQPEGLPKGCATFEVRVLAGDEELASQRREHTGAAEQKASFTYSDFEDLDEDGRWEARIEVSVGGETSAGPKSTEDFLLLFGAVPPRETVAAGEVVRCPVEGLVGAQSLEEVEEAIRLRAQGKQGSPDKKGFLAFRLPGAGRAFRVERPKLLAEIEADWVKRKDTPVVRWVVQVRPDGSVISGPDGEPLDVDGLDSSLASRLSEAAANLRKDVEGTGGTLSRTYLHNQAGSQVVADYLNVWKDVLEAGPAKLALANTLAVQDSAGQQVGLIVLPFHPVRMAWQAAYDSLALQLRFEEGLSPAGVKKALKELDGSHYPFLLPGLQADEFFVFGDCFGLAGVAMVSNLDGEPKSSVALMAAAFTGDSDRLAPAIGSASGSALAREIRTYLETHPACHQLRVHALKPGDAATVVRALGKALEIERPDPEEDDEHAVRDVSVKLDLYPSKSLQVVSGRYLTNLDQRRRSGAAAPPREDAWCLESLDFGGGRLVPRLRWAKRREPAPVESGHLSIAFDSFRSRVEYL
ncbi:MAG: hypothetical protein SNJ76_13380, partial [Fimbriimonadaceae bacterium]